MDGLEELGGEGEELEVSDRDLEVLQSFDGEQDTSLAFQGLKRKLGLHAETLSRSLKRLERDALLERTDEGYRLTGKGLSYVGNRRERSRGDVLQIFQAYLPYPNLLQDLQSRLRSRWFGSLRWLGSFTKDEGLVMSWVTEDGGSQVNVGFGDGFVTVEAVIDDEVKRENAIRSAYSLVSQIARAYSSIPSSSSPSHGIHALVFGQYNAS